MLALSDNIQAGVVEAFNSTSTYLDDLLNIDHSYFEQMVSKKGLCRRVHFNAWLLFGLAHGRWHGSNRAYQGQYFMVIKFIDSKQM